MARIPCEQTDMINPNIAALKMDLLLGLNEEKGITLIVVTHDQEVAKHTQRTVRLFDGRVQDE